MPSIHSYVVRYDSGFAPNPFYGYCTLATCKPDIRKSAKIGDWVVGSGSNDKRIQRGGHIVYAMKVTCVMTFEDYSADARFEKKKPFRVGSRKQSCGDNIYYRAKDGTSWCQRDSFHSKTDGTLHQEHVEIDTAVNRILVSDKFVYYGGAGPVFPNDFVDHDGRPLCKTGIGRSKFEDPALIHKLEDWFDRLDANGYQGPPQEWMSLRDKAAKS